MKFSKTKNKILIFLVIILVVGLLNVFQHNVRDFFYSFSSPVQKSLWAGGASISDFLTSIFKAGDLKAENEKLKSENQELLFQIANLKEIEKENAVLKSALEIGLLKDFKFVFSQVISKNVGGDIIAINKGSEDGLEEGFPAVDAQKNLIGKISEVYKHFSKVRLITDKESSFDAKISATAIYGVVKGEGDQKASFTLIPREAGIKSGDLLETTSLGDVFPDGLLVGQIMLVKKSDVESFQSAKIQPAFDISRMDNLFVIIDF